MRSCNAIYQPRKNFSVHISSDHNHVYRYKPYSLKRNQVELSKINILSNIQVLPLPNSRLYTGCYPSSMLKTVPFRADNQNLSSSDNYTRDQVQLRSYKYVRVLSYFYLATSRDK